MAGEKCGLGFAAAAGIVVANMIGTGVFTSLGFQLAATPSAPAVLALWVAGGAVALCGALAYGALGEALPRSGGEYHYLTHLLHPFAGFLAGWVSVTIGFAAPIALAAMAFGGYLQAVLPGTSPVVPASLLIVAITAAHALHLRWGTLLQNAFVVLKVALIIAIIAAAFVVATSTPVTFVPTSRDLALIVSPEFAVSMVFVSYAYSGWNSAAYLASEVRDPARIVPRALLLGTALVTLLYVLLNAAFLYTTPIAELAGKVEIGLVAGLHVLGPPGAQIMALLICSCLVSTVSGMVMAGPRVLKVMGEDYPRLLLLARENRHGTPWVAILLQSLAALVLLWTATFEQVLTYTGFTLTLFTCLTVACVFRLRRMRVPGASRYHAWAFPWAPIVFLVVNAWMLAFLVAARPRESAAGLLTLAAGAVVYAMVSRGRSDPLARRPPSPESP